MDEINNSEVSNDSQKENISYKDLFNQLIEGFALHEIVCNDKGEPINYKFIEINPAFEKLVGIKNDDIIGKLVLDILPETEPFWIETYGNVALKGESIVFEHYSQSVKKYYQVTSFSPKKYQFVALFEDITSRKEDEEKLNNLLIDLKKNNEIMIGRELKMIELKDRIRELELKIKELENKLSNK